jgi:hypothetical protein
MATELIKIPKLYPTETIEIEGNKIELQGYKAYDHPLVLTIEAIQRGEIRPILKKVTEMQRELTEMGTDEEGNTISNKELKENGNYQKAMDISDEIIILMDKVREIEDRLIQGDIEEGSCDEMKGPAAILTQRGLKRFYYPNTPYLELDEIDDIEIGRKYIIPITNTIIAISKPPIGLERSIKAREEEEGEDRATDKGKSSKGKNTSRSKKKSKNSVK